MAELKARLFAANKTRYTTIDVPVLGPVRLRSLTTREMRELRDSFVDEKGKPTKRLDYVNELLVASCIVDDDGNRVVSDEDATGGVFDDVDGGAFATLIQAARKHTNYAADPDWKAIEDAAKNSAATG